MRRNPIIVTVVLFIIGLIFTLLGAGWSQRPIIDYKISTLPGSFNFEHGSMKLDLEYRNRGSIDSSLNLVITVTDGNVTVDQPEPWMEGNQTQRKFHVAAMGHMDTYSSQAVNVSPVGDPQNFTITYTIEDTSDGWSINGIISHLFLEAHSYYPTQVIYYRTSASTYELPMK
jgi:hypothetical protein